MTDTPTPGQRVSTATRRVLLRAPTLERWARIRTLLQTAAPLPPCAIASALHEHQSTVDGTLRHMYQRGIVVRTSAGWYVLREEDPHA